jgi:PPM family protein phosphatase
MSIKFDAAGQTDIGKKRKINQDAFLIDKEKGLFIVADGLGGHRAGEKASVLAAETVHNFFEINFENEKSKETKDNNINLSPTASSLHDSIEKANQLVHLKALNFSQYNGMGTTIAAVCLKDKNLISANVGDSPIFLIQKGNIYPLSETHTVEEEHSIPETSQLNAFGKNYWKMLTRAIGIEEKVKPYLCEIPVYEGDSFVLCSDGLSKAVTPEEIAKIVQRYSAKEACSLFIELANTRGGKDNITVIVIKIKKGGLSRSKLVYWASKLMRRVIQSK